ncbi:MAG: urea transporter [Saprospiraceae bacterium]|nr:urea transporter [Saprospiraceae bacterium]
MKEQLKLHTEGFLNSYAQIFFSKHKALAVLIVLASFINPDLGFWGFLGVLFTNGLASFLGFNPEHIRDGLFGLNGVLVVFGLAASFQYNVPYLLIFFSACLLCLLVSVASLHYLARLGLPFLSLPFLIAFWVILLASRQYESLLLNEGDIYILNDLYSWGGIYLVNLYHELNTIELPRVVEVYLHSLSAILFQGNILTGLLIALGILISSRISFCLSLLGFGIGYAFYGFLGGDMVQVHYSHIGFNFILSAIAIGGFFYIPSLATYMLVVLVTPVIAMLIATFSALFLPFQLPVLSLPFAIIVILVVYTLQFSIQKKYFQKVVLQQYSPEKNLYAFQNYQERFGTATYYKLELPFYGVWQVSQGINGKHTHREAWQYAWDFEVRDENNNSYRNSGTELLDYYTYGLPVLATAAGYVVEILDGIEDNSVGEMNLENNWGNTIVIKHAEQLYTQISHLKSGSFQVKKGDYVQKGALLAYLGNSGRSPQPHVHYQVQRTPYIGSKTIAYPIADYMLHDSEGTHLQQFSYPKEGERISNIQVQLLLQKAFGFMPGQLLTFEMDDGDEKTILSWEVGTNALGYSYLECKQTGAQAYFVNDGKLFYFTAYNGSRDSALYYFYLGAYKILLAYYQDLTLEDQFPLHTVDTSWGRYLQDFIAPFCLYQQWNYELNYIKIDNVLNANEIQLSSRIQKKAFGRTKNELSFNWLIKNQKIHLFQVKKGKKLLIFKQLDNSAKNELMPYMDVVA